MLHGDSAFVCMCVTLQECNYYKHISMGVALLARAAKESKHYHGLACREEVVIRMDTCAATQKQ